jgi:NAD(P)H-hydrate epimerase
MMSRPLVFTAAQLREYDRLAAEHYGIPSIVLMENAARAVCEIVLARPVGGTLIVCGRGNNGGDGFAVARHLHNHGVHVLVIASGTAGDHRGDAGINFDIITRMGLPVRQAADLTGTRDSLVLLSSELGSPLVIVDAILGTGATMPVREPAAALISAVNHLRAAAGATVVSIDVPSGLNADTGEPLGPPDAPAVIADHTVTFVGAKRGFLAPGAQAYLGSLTIAEIGAPRALAEHVLSD